MKPSGPGGTCTTRAPRPAWACQICALVGNSKSVTTTLLRLPVKSRALASALSPADTEAVTAISSGLAFSSVATPWRTASFLPTHRSQLAPSSRRSSI
jgi:hypothetical protein